MGTSVGLALLAAMPELQERIPLARQIRSAEQVAAMETADLKRLQEAHDAERLMLKGKIEASANAAWVARAQQALRVLNLHVAWINLELATRKKAAERLEQRLRRQTAAEARKAEQHSIAERKAAADAAKLLRIKTANDENAQHIAVFKEVAREVLGDEMYSHLWQLTDLRLRHAA